MKINYNIKIDKFLINKELILIINIYNILTIIIIIRLLSI